MSAPRNEDGVPHRRERLVMPPGEAPRDESWPGAWRDFHHGVRIGALWVGPPWEQPSADAVAVVIDPGRAFGTGAHATTRLCLELLQDAEPGSLLDVGSGSGVLSIAAAKLGFAPVAVRRIAPVVVLRRRLGADRSTSSIAGNARRRTRILRPVPPQRTARTTDEWVDS